MARFVLVRSRVLETAWSAALAESKGLHPPVPARGLRGGLALIVAGVVGLKLAH